MCRVEICIMFIRIHVLMFSAMVLENAVDIFQSTDDPDIENEENDANEPCKQIEREITLCQMHQVSSFVGKNPEEENCQAKGDDVG